VATALGDGLVDLLGRGGVHGAPAREALRVLIVFTIGFAALHRGRGCRGPFGVARTSI